MGLNLQCGSQLCAVVACLELVKGDTGVNVLLGGADTFAIRLIETLLAKEDRNRKCAVEESS